VAAEPKVVTTGRVICLPGTVDPPRAEAFEFALWVGNSVHHTPRALCPACEWLPADMPWWDKDWCNRRVPDGAIQLA